MACTDDPNSPSIAVVIPAYNAAGTIDRAVSSIERQTYTNWEVVIADDASTDDTADRARQHPQVKVVQQPQNSGLTKTRDLAVDNARADIIALMDADDESHPERLEVQVKVLQALEDRLGQTVMLFTGRLCVTPDGRRWVSGGMPGMSGRVWLTSKSDVMLGTHYPLGATLMMRRAAYLELGGQSLSGVDQELDPYARAANRGWKLAHVGLPLYVQHLMPQSRQHFVKDRAARFERILQLWDPQNPDTFPDRRIDAEAYRAMCCAVHGLLTERMILKGFHPEAREQARKATMYGRLPLKLRIGTYLPGLYRYLNGLRAQLIEAQHSRLSEPFLRANEQEGCTMMSMLRDDWLEDALRVASRE